MHLYPTRSRVDLLEEVDAGEVWQRSSGRSVVSQQDTPGGCDPVGDVTDGIEEMLWAGWVCLVEIRPGARQWQLTNAGRDLLDEVKGLLA
jgi:hypothetical protein